MGLKAHAMVLEKFNQPLVYKEFEISDIPRGSILVEILSAGVCGSDVHMFRGEDPRVPLPIILGHEGAGRVVEVNGEKRDLNGELLKPGDLIVWNRGITCGECYWCKVSKEPYLCPNRKVYGINRGCSEYPHLRGCYSSHIVLDPETDVLKVSEKDDLDVLAMAMCSGATAYHAFDEYPESFAGKTVVIQGAGPLGLFGVVIARSLGAENVIVIAGSPNRLKLAEEIGADLTLNRRETSVEERRKAIMDITHGRGADFILEATGDSRALLEGSELLRRGGFYSVAGVAVPQDPVPFKVYEWLVLKNATFKGIWVSDTSHFVKTVSITSRNYQLLSKLITHRLPLKEANKALELMESREALKVILYPEG
ncbi:alcohol dehydrogenase [Thermotoga maritima MSB8]|nr:zinc-binding dehydrogenase [Thermotoga maritima]AGL49358.1 L-threonine 3-dehydrogenase [Thermotoga maritima MSB8]AKE26365.1 alcohol dehydrogenase [Thermotoga maritima]AKE28229.1 alcohol dehydrogenase [Thermotoga maritima MSB8]AKE30103.1 alcohol dehydrogenase [Thermotoga maritima]